MGASHVDSNFLGQHFGDAGLRDLLIENEVAAARSIAGVLNEHDYSRAVRANKTVYEVLLRQKWFEFGSWMA